MGTHYTHTSGCELVVYTHYTSIGIRYAMILNLKALITFELQSFESKKENLG